jgi:hypothetical protein
MPLQLSLLRRMTSVSVLEPWSTQIKYSHKIFAYTPHGMRVIGTEYQVNGVVCLRVCY